MEEPRTKKVTVTICADMHQALKIRAASEGRSMSEIMEEILRPLRIYLPQKENQ